MLATHKYKNQSIPQNINRPKRKCRIKYPGAPFICSLLKNHSGKAKANEQGIIQLNVETFFFLLRFEKRMEFQDLSYLQDIIFRQVLFINCKVSGVIICIAEMYLFQLLSTIF